jgi:8-oxo-dGTP pyrophosphatase MutT (NUDIX family)
VRNDNETLVVTHVDLATIRKRLTARKPMRLDDREASQAAVSMVLVSVVDTPDVELLLIERAKQRGDPWSGQMAFPGGRRQHDDADLLATAARETLEETGVDLRAAMMLGELDELGPSSLVLPRVVVRPFVFGLPGRPTVTPNYEVESHVWITLDALRAAAGQAEVEVRGRARRVAAYRVGPHVVWGLTERIITPFLDLLSPGW